MVDGGERGADSTDEGKHTGRNDSCLQCFDAVGWASGRASGL